MTMTEVPGPVRRGPGVRYGQLTYTSFDQRGGSGGWQVKDRVALSDDEADALRSRVNTQLDAGTELPRFPTPEDIRDFPRRLLYGPAAGGRAWWHAAPAGNDASGRPGNIFVQALLDREPQRERARRPIELWRSPDWLTPYGADEVNAAALPDQVTARPGPTVSLESVIGYLLDYTIYRLGRFGAVLDACAQALAGGPKVVLIAEDVDTAALWLGGVSFLMPPAWAARAFGFSTLERVSGVHRAFEHGVVAVAVPPLDRSQAEQLDNAVVIDLDAEVQLGELGGNPHRTSLGAAIPVTEWSVIAQVVLIDETSARTAITTMDQLCAGLESAGDEPGWGLAMVVSRLPEFFADADAEAARIIARSSPVDLAEGSELFASAAGLLDQQLGETADRAWSLVDDRQRQGNTGGPVWQMLLAGYVHRALADDAWLSGEVMTTDADGRRWRHPVPLPADPRLGPDAAAQAIRVARATARRLQESDSDPDRRGRAVATLADLVARLGLVDAELDARLRRGLRELVAARLVGPEADRLIERLGPFTEETQARYLRPVLAAEPTVALDAPPGQRLSPAAAFWLYPRPPAPEAVPPELDEDALWLRVEYAAHCLATDPMAYERERPLVVWATLDGPGRPDERFGAHFHRPWAAADLLAVRRRFSDRVDDRWLLATLKVSPPDPALAQLCGEVLMRRGADREVRERLFAEPAAALGPEHRGIIDLAALRSVGDRLHLSADPKAFHETLRMAVNGGAYAARRPDLPYDPSTVRVLIPVAVLAAVHEIAPTELTELRRALPPGPRLLGRVAAETVTRGLDGRVRWGPLGLAAMAVDDRFPEPSLVTERNQWLDDCVVRHEDGGDLPVLGHYLFSRIKRLSNDAEDVKQATADEALRLSFGRLENPERTARAIERFAASWIKTLLGTGRPPRRKASS